MKVLRRARGKVRSLFPWAVLAFVSCMGSLTPQALQSPKHTDLSPHFRISTSDSGAGNKLAQSALTPYPFLLLHLFPPPPPAQRTCPACRTGLSLTVVPPEMLWGYAKGYVRQHWVTCGSEVRPWNLAQLPLRGHKMQRLLSVSLPDRTASEISCSGPCRSQVSDTPAPASYCSLPTCLSLYPPGTGV